MHFKRILVALVTLVIFWTGSIACAADYNMPYYIDVDITNQIVTIYKTEDNSIVRQMMCSSGMNDCTPNGTFYLMPKGRLSERGEWTWFEQYQCWVKFATRIYKGYMFHSLPFAEKDESTMIEQMAKEFGMPTSHGCLRLRVDDARFIAKECLQGTRVNIFKSDIKEDELRELLRVSSYVADEGMSYTEYLGYSEDSLGRGAVGTEVSDLQHRLIDLGYYDGEASGSYETDTIAAVKRVQQDLGLKQNGIASGELLEVLYSDAAPVSAGQATLTEGRSGPVVKKLQTALQTLGFYAGEIDSVYDVDVSEAVRAFQSACGYAMDGVATAEIQQALYYQIGKLEETFGAGSIPVPEMIAEEIPMAILDAEVKIHVRSQPNTESESLGKLSDGDTMIVNATQDGWASITVNGVNGYLKTKYIDTYTDYNYILKFTGADGATYQMGHTLEEYKAGAKRIADEFSAYYASEQFASSAEETVDYVTVNTGADDIKLNLRAAADSAAEVLVQVPNGTSLRVLAAEDGWTRVGYGEQIGYLLNDYLTFWQGSVDDVEAAEEVDEEQAYAVDLAAGSSILAVVIRGGEDEKVEVYKEASLDAEVAGTLPDGEQVEIKNLNLGNNWVLISYEGHEGYMLNEYLQFQLIE